MDVRRRRGERRAVVVLRLPVSACDARRYCAPLARGEADVLVCDLVAVPEAADLAVVDALARLDLAASRVGGRIAVQGMTADLLELLRLVGLDELARS